MKKRIGTKLYDTETSEKIEDVGIGIIYRKKTRAREWFLLIGEDIEPLDDGQAKALLGKSVYIEKKSESKRIMIGVDRKTHEKIAELAKKDGVSISDEVKKIVFMI